MHRLSIRLLFCLLLLLPASHLRASHYLGGELRYQKISSNNSYSTYRIYLTYYQDCHHGNEQAIDEDAPVYLSVFKGLSRLSVATVPASAPPELLPMQPAGCATFSETQCIRKLTFICDVTLTNNDSYLITNERCCMPTEVRNLNASGQQGITLSIRIFNTFSGPNSSPVFKNSLPGFWCKGTPFSFDLSATDPDGDSLSYRLVSVPSGGTANDAKPNPPGLPNDPVVYAPGYSEQSPFGTAGAVSLNPLTGRLTGICNGEGSYLIGVACDKWRDGVLLTSAYRYYGYTFDDCRQSVTADIERNPLAVAVGDFTTLISQCNGDRTVHFTNKSGGGLRYHWDFGDPGRADDTSAAEHPSYTYPDTGTYTVTLQVAGNGCTASLTGNVVIGDAVPAPDFRIDGGGCVLDSVFLTDQTAAGSIPVQQYLWVTDSRIFAGASAALTYTLPGSRKILHVVRSENGCYAGAERDWNVATVSIGAGNDTTLVVGTRLQLHATGGIRYEWIHLAGTGTTLSDPSIGDPVLTAVAAGSSRYALIGMDGAGCRGLDTLTIITSSQGYAFVPNVFTPNGDGRNDLLHCHLAGTRLLRFSIYDRSGARVFTTTDIGTGWDGRYHGGEAAMATYYWMIEAVSPFRTDVFKGDVLLMR